MSFLEVNKICKTENGNLAIDNISFSQKQFQKLAIAGETGSGKTTLLKLVAGLAQLSFGQIIFLGKKVVGPWDQLIPGYKGIAYLSQYFELRNNYWVHEILEYANKMPIEKARQLYSICQIEHLLKRRTNQLSGGEKQRIALARLLTTQPKLLLLDEPFSNLDVGHKIIMKEVIKNISDELEITCTLVSHDVPDMLSWADTIIVLKDGKMVQQGNAEQVFNNPVSEYCASIFGEYNLLEPATALAFGLVLHLEMGNKKIMIRPAQLQIVTPNFQLPNGVVTQVLFCGAYYLVDVQLPSQMLRVQTQNGPLKIGDKVFLSLRKNEAWYL